MPYQERNLDERKLEIKNIMTQLSSLDINPTFPEIKELYKLFKQYLTAEHSISVNILIPELKRRVKGNLAVSKADNVYLKMVAI